MSCINFIEFQQTVGRRRKLVKICKLQTLEPTQQQVKRSSIQEVTRKIFTSEIAISCISFIEIQQTVVELTARGRSL